MKLLILGATGNLGSELIRQLNNKKIYDVIGWSSKDCNLFDQKDLNEKIGILSPDIIINTVAYNNVDACENDLLEQRRAIDLNVILNSNLANVSNLYSIKLIHFSTNYVFSGEADRYDESAKKDPMNFYGLSKSIGEDVILNGVYNAPIPTIIRISNLFGKKGNSNISKPHFFDVIEKLAKENAEIKVINDETMCFTYSKDIAEALADKLADDSFCGIYHFVNNTPCSWYDAASMYFDILGIDVNIIPVSNDKFKRSAKRPKDGSMISSRIKPLRPLYNAVEDYVREKLKDVHS